MREGIKRTPRPRGRPRAYEPDTALARATEAFWRLGFSGASLEQLSDATDMNRPSMYAAFGDKRSLYLRTLDRYTQLSNESIARALDYQQPLATVLRRFYAQAIASYLPSGEPALGCYLIGTATTEAAGDPEVRARLGSALREFNRALEARFRHAREAGDLDVDADPAALATIASAVLHTLAVRSRAGDSRASLDATADTAVKLLCGTAPPRAAGRRERKKS